MAACTPTRALPPLRSFPTVQGLDANRSAPHRFHVANREIYLHLPNGMAQTKLTSAYFDSKLSTIATAATGLRVLKLLEMMA
jgi:hypothetical protein